MQPPPRAVRPTTFERRAPRNQRGNAHVQFLRGATREHVGYSGHCSYCSSPRPSNPFCSGNRRTISSSRSFRICRPCCDLPPSLQCPSSIACSRAVFGSERILPLSSTCQRLHGKFGSAPASSRIRTSSTSPRFTAIKSGVSPSCSCRREREVQC